MLTSQDIKLLVDTFKTRAEADEDLRKLKEEMATKGMFREVMNKLDAVYTELKDMRQEQDIHVQKHRDIDEKLDKLGASI